MIAATASSSSSDGGAASPSVTLLWATESGRAKACARRALRLLRSNCGIADVGGRCTVDALDLLALGRPQQLQPTALQPSERRQFLILFVSTTGDAEVPSTLSRTWARLLSKSLPATQFSHVDFALFALGDRAYGPDAFCAAGRKLAARLAQLGATPVCRVGYGDDGSPNGGVFADLDVWLEGELFPAVRTTQGAKAVANGNDGERPNEIDLPYEVHVASSDVNGNGRRKGDGVAEWQRDQYSRYYCGHFRHSCPPTAYQYNPQCERLDEQSSEQMQSAPLLGRVTVNQRITANDWIQDTRHIRIHVSERMEREQSTPLSSGGIESLPYRAGDVTTIIPSNPVFLVDRFLSVLPPSIRALADEALHIAHKPNGGRTTMNHPWPERCTLRGLLNHCADLQSLPEQEDLYTLSAYCNLHHHEGREQKEKLISLSETSGAALYGDYIIREKRNWADVFYDFDSIRWESGKGDAGGGVGKGSLLTLSHLLAVLPSIAPRHFSIASSPSYLKLQSSEGKQGNGFELELCVAVVEGTTPFGRPYAGCCSKYLASIVPNDSQSTNSSEEDIVRLWIHAGSFAKLPIEPLAQGRSNNKFFEAPVMCIGAGTGIAPLRSLILEREANRLSILGLTALSEVRPGSDVVATDDVDNQLVFGCRKKAKDYYYGDEWQQLTRANRVRRIPAFSRDQEHKLYVQRALREADGGQLIASHILERGGAVYIAGGSKMARAVKDEIVEALGARLEGGEKDAKRLLNKLKRLGLFSIEAWS
ncbi:hypothetical protein ACHAXT_003370 [Thalassiosira profunda]